MVEHSAAESKWGDLLAIQGVLNNLNHAEAREVVQDFLREITGKGNLGNQAFNALRNVNHPNLMSSDYEDQLMSFEELYTHLESFISLIKYTECSMPAADLQMTSYKVKLAYVEFLHPHTKNWLEAHVRVAGNLICLYDDDGVTAHELQQELVTYYSDHLNSRGKRIPSEAAPRLLRGDGSTRGNDNGKRQDRDDDDQESGGRDVRARHNGSYQVDREQEDNTDDQNQSGGHNGDRSGNHSNEGGGRSNQNTSSTNETGRPGANDPCPFHKRKIQERSEKESYHLWGDCRANIFSDNFKTNACIRVLNREDAPRWFVNECKRELNLSPKSQWQEQRQEQQQGQQQQQQQERQQQQYHFGGLPPFIPAQGGSYVFMPAGQPQQPMTIPAQGGSYVFQAAGQAAANQQQPQQQPGGSYMNLPTPATATQAQRPSQFEVRADGTLGWRR